MWTRSLRAAIAIVLTSGLVWGQEFKEAPGGTPATAWRSAEDGASQPTVNPEGNSAAASATPAGTADPAGAVRKTPAPTEAVTAKLRQPIARVTGGTGTLPNNHGQVWREYDISPYTLRVTTTKRPEQAVVDWVLRETGYEAWHSEVLAVLSATPRVLRVYHTPEMQAVVADMVDRFVNSGAQSRAFSLRVVTTDHPGWRASAQQLLRPVAVQTPGVRAWLMQKEDAAILLAELRRRSDFREHSSPYLLVNNGQSTVVSLMRGRNYVRSVSPRADVWPGYEADMGEIAEGFSLEFSPLLSVDGQTIDAVVKCNVDQVEKMIPVMIDVPTTVAPRQRTKIEIPQITHFRFHERFRWPVEQVLLIGMGMVALPIPADGKTLVPGIPLPLPSGPARADLMVFVECRGNASQSTTTHAAHSKSLDHRPRR